MKTVRLFHWNSEEAAAKIEVLVSSGYEVSYFPQLSQDFLKKFKASPPDAVVIDLTRIPSHGREIALALREQKATRYIPIVFVEGDPPKVAGIRNLLPDAVYGSWKNIRSILKTALAHPPINPVVPGSRMAAYAGRSLVQKLGIKPDMGVVLIKAPKDFKKTLGELPSGVRLKSTPRGDFDITLYFVITPEKLAAGIESIKSLAGHGPVWIIWPKGGIRAKGQLTQQQVRDIGLAQGLVDYKISSIDETWSGLLFKKRG